MSVIDQVIAAVTPPESEQDRREAHDKARAAATPGDWLSLVLDHHEAIDAAFARLKSATTADEARTAEKALGEILTAHAQAEEIALYPALAKDGQKGHATLAYTEQATTKMQMAELERLEPLSQDYHDKLGHIEGAVKHHVYSEEGTWFLDMKASAPAEDQQTATDRYREEFDRYMSGGSNAPQTVGGPSGTLRSSDPGLSDGMGGSSALGSTGV